MKRLWAACGLVAAAGLNGSEGLRLSSLQDLLKELDVAAPDEGGFRARDNERAVTEVKDDEDQQLVDESAESESFEEGDESSVHESKLHHANSGDGDIVDYRRLTAYGRGRRTYEGEGVEKTRHFRIDGITVPEEEFNAELVHSETIIAFTSQAGSRQYPNQDNFLIDIIQQEEKDDPRGHAPLMSLVAVWDGHGADSHVLTDFLVEVVRKRWESVVEDLFADFNLAAEPHVSEDMLLPETLEDHDREARLIRILNGLFSSAQREYEEALADFDDEHSSLLRRISDAESHYLPDVETRRQHLAIGGATMSVVIIDHVRNKMYTGGVGDSPILAKFADGKLRPLVGGHNARDYYERENIIRRLRRKRYRFSHSEVNSSANGRYVMRLFFVQRKQNGQRNSVYLDFTARLGPDGVPYFDFRIGNMQPSRSIGHAKERPGVTWVPEVEVYDARTSQIDYLVVASDGLMHGLDMRSSYFLDRQEISAATKAAEQLGVTVSNRNTVTPRLFSDSFMKLFEAHGRPKKEVFSALKKFSLALHARDEAIANMGNGLIQNVLERQEEDGLKCFPELVSRISRKAAQNSDDSTAIMFRFPRDSAWRDRSVRESIPLATPSVLSDVFVRVAEPAVLQGATSLSCLTSEPHVVGRFSPEGYEVRS